MAIEIVLPIEFVVDGVPRSAQRGGGGSNELYKTKVREAARASLIGNEGDAPITAPLLASVYIFPRRELPGDLDNKLKFIFDALVDLVYEQDSQIKRLDVRAFEPGSGMTYRIASALLEMVVNGSDPSVYLRFSDDLNEEV